MSGEGLGVGAEQRSSLGGAVGIILNLGIATALFLVLNTQLSKQAALELNTDTWSAFSWAQWALAYWQIAPEAVSRWLVLFGVGFLGILVQVAVGRVILRRRRGPRGSEGLHGTAAWAKKADIEDAGLLGGPEHRGVYVGGWIDRSGWFNWKGRLRYLRHDGPEHCLAFAPTRSGKGVGLVLPTLLDWRGSALIHDPKGEAWAITAGWRREMGSRVLRFDPTADDAGAVRFNPLDEIRLGTDDEVSDAQNLATIICDPEGEGLKTHWDKTSQSLVSALLLHVCYVRRMEPDQDATLAAVARTLSNPDMTVTDTLHVLRGYTHLGDKPHPMIAEEAMTMLNRDEREMSSVLSTAISHLTLYRDEKIARWTSTSDFRVADLMNHDDPVSLYLVIRPSDADRLRPVVRLLVSQIVRGLTREMKFREGRAAEGYRHRLLVMLDEFPALKRLPVVEEALAYMAGYGLKAYLICQDLTQLTAVYGREESIVSNCHIRVAYPPNRIETAEILSKLSGDQTISHRQVSASGKGSDLVLQGVSESVQDVRRALLTPDEIMRLPAPRKSAKGDIIDGGDMLIFAAGARPIYGRQILYFKDPVFSKRSRIAAPAISDRLQGGDEYSDDIDDVDDHGKQAY